MSNLERAIAEWRRQMAASGVKTSESLNELEAHLRDDVEHSIRSGRSAEQAFEGAVQRLGSTEAIRKEFSKCERARCRYFVHRGLVIGIGVFLLGEAFCYFAMIPAALAASQAYSQWLGFSAIRWKPDEYISFVWRVMLGMSLGFEVPVVVLTLVKIGVVKYRFLAKARKYVIIINLGLAALLTTPEVITQLVLFLPLQLLYEISALVTWYWECPDKKRETTAESSPG